MRIINLGICVDNIDPKGFGRIRFLIHGERIAPKEGSKKYIKWDHDDFFVASPFLPTNINFVPEIGQSVKIISYDTETNMVNQEYVAGPFSTMHDFNSQTFLQQTEDTSYGAAVKVRGDIFSSDGTYRDPKSEGAFAKDVDYGIYGKYGSDVIFTENGLQLRGGKLVSKKGPKGKDLYNMLTFPHMTPKSSKICLKKFPRKLVLDIEDKESIKIEKALLNHIVEYSVDDLASPTEISIYVYKVNSEPKETKIYQTDNFTNYTELYLSGLTLLNLDNNTGTAPTLTISVDSISASYIEIRNALNTISESGLKGIDKLYTNNDLHPFYFRPTSEFRERSGNDTEKETILNNIIISKVGPGNGLIWSLSEAKPPQKLITEKVTITKYDSSLSEQTFGAVCSDKIYLISTDVNEAGKSIPFDELDKYELTQEDYIAKIGPNTYSTVRGEILLELIRAMYVVLKNHVHNINSIYVTDAFDPNTKMEELILKMENDLLNKSIRIN